MINMERAEWIVQDFVFDCTMRMRSYEECNNNILDSEDSVMDYVRVEANIENIILALIIGQDDYVENELWGMVKPVRIENGIHYDINTHLIDEYIRFCTSETVARYNWL